MKYTAKQNGNKLEVAVEGRLDTVSAPELQKALEPLVHGMDELIFDFSNLDYISSAGLRTLLWAHQNLNMHGKTHVIHCNPVVKAVFDVTGFDDVFDYE